MVEAGEGAVVVRLVEAGGRPPPRTELEGRRRRRREREPRKTF